MTPWYKRWPDAADLLKVLRSELPVPYRIHTRTARRLRVEGDPCFAACDVYGDVAVIWIDLASTRYEAREWMHHEYAHLLAWGREVRPHDKAWSDAWGRIYRAAYPGECGA